MKIQNLIAFDLRKFTLPQSIVLDNGPEVHGAAASVIKRLACSSLSESNPPIGVSSLLGDPIWTVGVL